MFQRDLLISLSFQDGGSIKNGDCSNLLVSTLQVKLLVLPIGSIGPKHI